MEKIKSDIQSDYNLELERVIKTIKQKKAKLVCIQLPEGLKPLATKIVDEIESNTKAKGLIWLGSCYGACDVPNLDHIKPKIDLLIQWGHSPWKK
jgi:diphthamide biosynthesis enzyme Dph1/Dph2-like protein